MMWHTGVALLGAKAASDRRVPPKRCTWRRRSCWGLWLLACQSL